jgi:hypothetical protein
MLNEAASGVDRTALRFKELSAILNKEIAILHQYLLQGEGG